MSLPAIDHNPFAACGSPDEVGRVLERYVGDLGLPYYSYLVLRMPRSSRGNTDSTLVTNYPKEWRSRYLGRSYKLYDPVADLGARSRLPFTWGSEGFLRPFRKSQRQIFYEARAFRIVNGYSVPVSGPDGDIGVFSVVGTRSRDLVDAVAVRRNALQLTAVQVHDRMIGFLRGDETAAMPTLSARERECLRWTAEGKTTDEIAEIICVAASTVNYHLGKAVRKLGARNKHHAAIIAIRDRQI